MTDPARNLWQRIRGNRLFWPAAGLGLLCLYNLIFDPAFYELSTLDGHLYGPLVTVVRQSGRVLFVALGMTLVIATSGVDLSVGSVMAVTGTLVASLSLHTDMGPLALIALPLLLAILLGALNGVAIASAGIQPIVVTLIMMVLARGVAFNITGGNPLEVKSEAVLALGRGYTLGMPNMLFVVVIVFAVAAILMRRTAIGLYIEAVGDNETASRFSGLPTGSVKILVYAFSGCCAGLAALLSIGNVGIADADKLGLFLELDAITAVVVGGTALTGGRFSMLGSVIGVFLIKTLEITLIRHDMNPAYAPVPKALVILLVCLLQSGRFRNQMARLFSRSPARAA